MIRRCTLSEFSSALNSSLWFRGVRPLTFHWPRSVPLRGPRTRPDALLGGAVPVSAEVVMGCSLGEREASRSNVQTAR